MPIWPALRCASAASRLRSHSSSTGHPIWAFRWPGSSRVWASAASPSPWQPSRRSRTSSEASSSTRIGRSVQEIGIRSTRIRGLDRSLITIPNATFVNMNIINLTNRDRMPYDRTIALQAVESAAICQEIEALAALVAEHPRIERGSVQVRLREGQEEKPKAEIQALILTSKWQEFLAIQQEIDLMLRDKVLAAGKARGESMPAFDNVVPLKEAEDG
jgi:hypothetical protein